MPPLDRVHIGRKKNSTKHSGVVSGKSYFINDEVCKSQPSANQICFCSRLTALLLENVFACSDYFGQDDESKRRLEWWLAERLLMSRLQCSAEINRKQGERVASLLWQWCPLTGGKEKKKGDWQCRLCRRRKSRAISGEKSGKQS